MRGSVAYLLVLLSVFPSFTYGDTMTLKTGTEVNGRITYKEPTFTVVAKFGSGVQTTLSIARAKVAKVEINSTDSNYGSPSPWVFDDDEKLRKPPKQLGGQETDNTDTVILMNGKKDKGKLVLINSDTIGLRKNNSTRNLKRGEVHSVVLGE